METWHIEMFGGLRLRRGTETITRFKSQKVASLLAYLAFYPTRRHLRDELLALLWPDDDIDVARNRLRVGLSSLRRQLEPPGVAAGSVLRADRVTAGLHPDAFSTDVAQFEKAYSAALHSEGLADQTSLLTIAVEAYGGSFLSGFYEDWILTERDRLGQSYVESLRRLTLALTHKGDYQRALAFAVRAVQADPYREEAHRDVMRLYSAIGQPSAALEQYEQLARICRDSFGSEPAASSRQLARQIAAKLGYPDHLDAGSFTPAPVFDPALPASTAVPACPEPGRPSLASTANLPVALTRFFGRELEQKALAALLTSANDSALDQGGRSRLVTLTGMGGTGKTRLALAAAQSLQSEFANRIWFIPLADLSDPEQISDAIAAGMRLPRLAQTNPLSQVMKALEPAPALLILDNFEHLVETGAVIVEELLTQIPALTCLITSRRTLGLPGEQEFPVSPLPVPDRENRLYEGSGETSRADSSMPLSELLHFPGIALFVDRAQAILPHFQLTPRNADDIAGLCIELEGIPLAIELAAARSRLLTPAQMRAYLPRRFDLLVNRRASKDVRHRSLHAALDWSYLLLSPEPRRVFALLSVFQGGASVGAVQAVCHETDALTALEELHSDSLIQVEERQGEMRFRMLETVREYAAEHLSVEETGAARLRHAAYYVELAEEADPNLRGPEQSVWLDRLQSERDNLRLAYETCLADPEGTRGGLRLTGCLYRFWMLRGNLREGRERAERMLARPDAPDCGDIYADALNAAGAMASAQEDYPRSRIYYEQELNFSRETGYFRGVAWASSNLGSLELRCGNYQTARLRLEEGLALHRQREHRAGVALCLSHLALVTDKLGDPERAQSLYQESLALHRALGDDVQIAAILGNLGLIAERENDLNSARAFQEQSLAIHQKLGNKSGEAIASANLGIVSMKQGDFPHGKARFLESLTLFQELEMPHAIALALGELGSVETLSKNYLEARRLQEEKLKIERRLDSREGIITALNSLATILVVMGDYDTARSYLTESLASAKQAGFQLGIVCALEGWAAVAYSLKLNETAVWLCGAADSLRKSLNAPLSSVQKASLPILLDVLLTESACASAFQAGSSATIQQAIETALSLNRPPYPGNDQYKGR